METSSITTELADEDKALKGLLDTFGSAFSLQDIASAFYKAGRDPDLASQILHGMQTDPSVNVMHVSNGFMPSKISPQVSTNDICHKSQYVNGNNSVASKVKRKPASVGTVSSALGKNYVWRVAQSNGIPNGTKPLKVEANEFLVPVSSSEESLSAKPANLNSSEGFSSAKGANLHEDVENFLFEMLGRGFQLERSAVQEVLAQCGYDMKKSLETLLDLTSASLDRRDTVHEVSNLHSNSEALSSQNQVPKQKISERNGSRANGILSRRLDGRYEQQQEVLTALFHVPERSDLTVNASVSGSARTSAVVSEPLLDIAEEPKAHAASPHFANMKGEADEDNYQILRKAVKEYRDTMKEYYMAAAESFASGDLARARLLLEKGQFFYSKAREADEESALKIFETSSGDGELQDDISLDLQDHDAKEAIRLVKCHLRSLSGIPLTNLKITIGKGDRDVEKRRRLVVKLLEKEAIKWIEDENSGIILIRLDEINPKSLSFARK